MEDGKVVQIHQVLGYFRRIVIVLCMNFFVFLKELQNLLVYSVCSGNGPTGNTGWMPGEAFCSWHPWLSFLEASGVLSAVLSTGVLCSKIFASLANLGVGATDCEI